MRKPRLKTVLLLALAVLTGAATVALMPVTLRAWETWRLNLFSVQERLYEAVGMFFAWAQMLFLCVCAFGLALWGLVRTLRPSRRTGRVMRFLREKGLYAGLLLAVVCLALCLADRQVLSRIAQTAETSEVPATLSERVLSGQLRLAAEAVACSAAVCLGAFFHGRKSGGRP